MLAYDEVRRKTAVARVRATRLGHSADFLVITGARGHALRCTSRHPLLTPRGWRIAGDLKTDDALLVRGEHGLGWERIAGIDRVVAAVAVYDLTVDPHHTFFADGVVVHNKLP